MPSTTVKGELFSWQHIVRPNAKDVASVAEDFALTTAEAAWLHHAPELPRLLDRGPWNMLTLHVPGFLMSKHAMERATLVLLYDKRHVVTLCDKPLPMLAALAPKGKRRAPKQFDHGTSTDIVAWILGAVFEGLHEITDDMMRAIERLERGLHRRQSDAMTRDLGRLRRDILMLDLMVDPARSVIEELLKTQEPHRSEASELALRQIRDRLRGIHVILDHYNKLVDGIFRMHETLLSHHTNRVVQALTIISVLLMPPTLITSYYGMNIADLPLAHDFRIVSLGLVAVVLLFLFLVLRIRR
ncbi:CorA family divalent cation transporter [Candidatus Uhrbacteria bacterium]|nr:CorA family divalent cation transporter [Candidatus Uhrbacteria bacterium]